MSRKVPLRWESACAAYRVVIRQRCVDELIETATKHLPDETGSSIYGFYSNDGKTAVVVGMSTMPADSEYSASCESTDSCWA